MFVYHERDSCNMHIGPVDAQFSNLTVQGKLATIFAQLQDPSPNYTRNNPLSFDLLALREELY